mmetsp:Transcript_60472/g.177352  ORF Transcript_60472/g.177352 Transcript_60472/m.177352 type:complete len:268 (-) Transcript_60472:142-945(-)
MFSNASTAGVCHDASVSCFVSLQESSFHESGAGIFSSSIRESHGLAPFTPGLPMAQGSGSEPRNCSDIVMPFVIRFHPTIACRETRTSIAFSPFRQGPSLASTQRCTMNRASSPRPATAARIGAGGVPGARYKSVPQDFSTRSAFRAETANGCIGPPVRIVMAVIPMYDVKRHRRSLMASHAWHGRCLIPAPTAMSSSWPVSAGERPGLHLVPLARSSRRSPLGRRSSTTQLPRSLTSTRAVWHSASKEPPQPIFTQSMVQKATARL